MMTGARRPTAASTTAAICTRLVMLNAPTAYRPSAALISISLALATAMVPLLRQAAAGAAGARR